MNCTTITALSLTSLLLLTATTQPVPAAERIVVPLTKPALPPSFLPTITVQDLMKDAINPNARALWEAVSYTVTEKGVTDTKPTTAADWAALRVKADALMKAAGTLMLPALLISNDQQTKTPDYQYSAAEIAQLRKQDADAWREYAQRLQVTTQALITDIEKRDVEAYTEHGSPINQACEGCHSQFWYRPTQRRMQ